jgi:hypothetical protein
LILRIVNYFICFNIAEDADGLLDLVASLDVHARNEREHYLQGLVEVALLGDVGDGCACVALVVGLNDEA